MGVAGELLVDHPGPALGIIAIDFLLSYSHKRNNQQDQRGEESEAAFLVHHLQS